MANIDKFRVDGTTYDFIDSTARTTANAAVPQTRTVNSKALSSDITINSGDIPYDGTATYTSGTIGEGVTTLKNALTGITNAVNLFDSTTTTDGKRLNASGGFNDSVDCYTSAYIPVVPNMSYKRNYAPIDIKHRIAVYDADGLFISGELYETNIVTIPTTGRYIKICGLLSEKSTTNVVLVSAADYSTRIAVDKLVSVWNGKTMLSFGDSQTAQNRWQPFVTKSLGVTSLVQGFSGLTVAVSNPNNVGNCLSSTYIMGQVDTYLADKDFDVMLIMGGTNDWRYDGVNLENYSNILIGENSDATNTTFKGALKAIVSHFQNAFPTKNIVLMSNIGGRSINDPTDTPATDMTAPLTNANGYTQATFAQATKEVAEYIGIPFIDVYSCGINIYNTADYLSDGLHINTTTGAKKVADCVINGLQNIRPYTIKL